MGLDMFLDMNIFIGAHYEHKQVKGTIALTQLEGRHPIPIRFEKVHSIVERVAQWRKANQIHNWFVQNVGDGVDECQHMWVSEEKLQELLDTCKRALKSHSYGKKGDKDSIARDELPPTAGLFFGSDQIDEWYWNDIKQTIHMLTEVLAYIEELRNVGTYVDLYYHASW